MFSSIYRLCNVHGFVPIFSRFRIIYTSRLSLTRIKRHYKCLPNIVLHWDTKKIGAVPILGLSLFTWLGFDEKKLSAEDELILSIKHCILFIQRGEFDKAEQLLHVCLRQAQQLHHELGITYIYDVMANLALEREQLDKAKNLFVAVAQRVIANGAKQDDIRVVHISAKLARISHLKREYETAQIGFDWCLEHLQKAIQTEPTEDNFKLLAITEDWYGRLFIECKKFEQGVKLLINSLNHMKEVALDENNKHIAVQLNDIGTTYHTIGNSDESINYLKEAAEVGEKVPDFEYLGVIYVNLGKALLTKYLLKEAKLYCGRGWKLSILSKNDELKNEAESCFKEISSLKR